MIAAPRTAVILLAAGLSRRYPGDKLMAEFRGRPLLTHAAETLARLPFLTRIAVVPPDRPARWEALSDLGFSIAVNMAPESGQGRSLRTGVEAALPQAPAAVLLALADMPFTPESHFLALLNRLDPDDPQTIAFSQGPDWRGPPAAFGAGRLRALLGAEGDEGARPLIRAAPESAGVAAPGEWLADLDSPEDFANASQ